MNELKELRQKNNFTCQDMSDKLNISKPFYWQIENGRRRLSYIKQAVAHTFPNSPG